MVSAKDIEKLTNDINNGIESATENIHDMMTEWMFETEEFIRHSVLLNIKYAVIKGNYECNCLLPFYPHDDWDYKDDVCWGYRWDYDEGKFEKACLFIRELKQLGYEITPMNMWTTGYKPSAYFTVSWLGNEKQISKDGL